jgi:hypothetical protein
MKKETKNELAELVSQAINLSFSEEQGREELGTEILRRIFNKLMAISNEDKFTQENEYGDFGLKLSSALAANCAKDYFRTVKYWQALVNALNDLDDVGTLRVLYPGCGPFATLVLPILTLSLNVRVELILLDATESSIENAKALWDSINSDQLSVTFLHKDVLTFADSLGFDIIVFECLLKALEQEAQVAITLHVSQLLKTRGRLIPKSIECCLVATSYREEIAVYASLKDKKDDTIISAISPYRKSKILILQLDKYTHNELPIVDNYIELGEFDLSTLSKQPDLVLTTVLHLDEQITINEYQSGLTFPTHVGWIPADSDIVSLSYRLRPMPEFFLQN